MADTGNVVASISHVPIVLIQTLREELALYAFTHTGTSIVTAAGIDKLDQGEVIVKEFRVREEAIQADGNLSDQGKRVKMEALAQEFFNKLRFISEAAENRRHAAAQLRAQLDALPKPPGDPIIEWMRGAEIRAQLRTLAQPERMKILTQSLEHKNLSILRAIENDPLDPNTLVSNEYRLRLKDQLSETNQAAEHARWKALVFVGDKLQLLANVLETTLGKYRIDVPTFPTPPIGKADLKSVNQQAPPDKSKAVDKKPEHVGAFQ